MNAARTYDELTRGFDWSIAEKELGYQDGDVINIGWHCSDRICQQGRGGKLALIWEDFRGAEKRYTFDDVRQYSNGVAAYLRGLGVQPGDRVCLFMDKVPELYIGFLGVLKLGAIAQPLFSAFGEEALLTRLDNAQTTAIFTQKKHAPKVRKILDKLPALKHVIVVDAEGAKLQPHETAFDMDKEARLDAFDVHPTRRETPSVLHYTSGTTGMPKGVMHSFGTFAWSVQSGLARLTMVDQNTRMLSYLPLAHVAERTLVEHGQLATGMRVYFAESLDTFTHDLQRARPTVFFSVPRLWVKFQQGVHAKMPPAKLERLLKIPLLGGIVRRKILTALGLDQCVFAAGGAAPMPPELLRFYDRLGLPIVEVYGMTENCGVSHSTLVGQPRPGTVGKPYRGIQHRIDPANGEIQMKSPGLMLGYYKEPALSAQAFTDDGWLHTGDKGQLDAEGNLKITGRVKDLFKTSKGKYVAPAPIEDRLVMHASIEACCVTGANLGQPLGIVMLNAEAVTRARNGGRADLEASLAEHLRSVNAGLDPHEQLDCLVVVTEPWTVDNGVITPTFKVKRNRVEELYATSYERWANSRQPVLWA